MLETIKQATKSHHSSVEKILVRKLKNLSSKEDYATLLYQLYGFYNTVEATVHSLINSSIVPDISQRKHVENLKSDLNSLGRTVENIENPFAETIDSISTAIGVLYVIEGSTLGGQIIASMLKKQIPSLNNNQLSYFLSYGEKTMSMWSSFKNNYDIILLTIDENSVVEGAKETFEKLEMWLTKD
ncbi:MULTISPECIES: biliverdin-producing heme oxygenase [unclassified Flavobacterium]|uniref:biliverdin-producing heme oxygenase n=1 Tax=unclassified Flavobacterium TaxID=196869 RepID=UPI003F917B02